MPLSLSSTPSTEESLKQSLNIEAQEKWKVLFPLLFSPATDELVGNNHTFLNFFLFKMRFSPESTCSLVHCDNTVPLPLS